MMSTRMRIGAGVRMGAIREGAGRGKESGQLLQILRAADRAFGLVLEVIHTDFRNFTAFGTFVVKYWHVFNNLLIISKL